MATITYSIEEDIIAALMIKVPLILVEGRDDIKIYEKICSEIGKKANIQAIEVIAGVEGCDHVINAINSIEVMISQNPNIRHFVLGIVDRDSRYYRQTLPDSECVFVLKYYSIESHFITNTHLNHLLRFTTCYPKNQNKKSLKFLNEQFSLDFRYLYYASLDALKNACIDGYSGVFGYSTKTGIVLNDVRKRAQIELIKGELDIFAQSLGLEYSFETLLKICKGKWLLAYFSKQFHKYLPAFQEMCRDNKIDQCQFCKKGILNKCLYKPNASYQTSTIEEIIKNHTDHENFSYLKERLDLLGKESA